MVDIPRYLERFTDRNGTSVITFPTYEYECEVDDDVVAPQMRGIGMDFAYDQIGNVVPSLQRPGSARVRGVLAEDTSALLDTSFDAMKAGLYLNAEGKLWSLGADGTRRWCWARVNDLPRLTVQRARAYHAPYVIGFRKDSFWFAEAVTNLQRTVTASGETWAFVNPGLLPARLMTIRLRANTAAGIINPKLTNTSNLYVFESARDSASANSEVRLITGQSPEYSNDDGATFVDDFANYVIPTNQQAFSFRLEAGSNNMKYEGGASQSLSVEIAFYAVYP